MSCRYALPDEAGDLCLLSSNRSISGAPALVFHGSLEFIPVHCDLELFRACPFKRSEDGRPISSKGTVPCEHCGGSHVMGSLNGRLCREWANFKRAYQEMKVELPGRRKYYLQGTRRPVYSEDCEEFLRRQLWHKVQVTIIRRDRFSCQRCGRDHYHLERSRNGRAALEVHHIVPRSLGGTDHPGNLMTLCRECHRQQTQEDLLPMRMAGEMEKILSIADPGSERPLCEDEEEDDLAHLGYD